MIPPSNGVATFRARIAEGFRDDGKLDHWDLEWAMNAMVNGEDPELDAVETQALRQLTRTDRFQEHATEGAKKAAASWLGEPLPEPLASPAAKLGWTAE